MEFLEFPVRPGDQASWVRAILAADLKGGWLVRPQEHTPPPRPRPAHDGAPLTEAELGQALRELRDTWAGLTQVTLAKRAGLSGSVVSARELGHGVPSTKVLDKFVLTCLKHRGLTPQEIITELGHWQKARNTLDLQRRQHTPTPQPDPAPAPPREPQLDTAPAARDDGTQQITPKAVLEATSGAESPGPAPDVAAVGVSPRWAGWTPRRWVMGAAAAAVVTVVGVIVLLGLYGSDAASGADNKQALRSALTPAQRLVDSPPYVAGATYSEIVNSPAGARTFSNPYSMIGEGQRIPNHTTVHVSCKVVASNPGSPSAGTYWYRITDPAWQNYYSPTNSFLNDDPITGNHTKPVDEKVPYCPE